MKGRVACEISSGDELLLTELVFNGAFNDLTVEQEVALLSCFVFQEKVGRLYLYSALLVDGMRILIKYVSMHRYHYPKSKVPTSQCYYQGHAWLTLEINE